MKRGAHAVARRGQSNNKRVLCAAKTALHVMGWTGCLARSTMRTPVTNKPMSDGSDFGLITWVVIR